MAHGVTIRDVAAAAQVSIGTASQVLQGKSERHAVETVRKVQDTAASLGYRPAARTRKAGRRRSETLGVVVEQLFHGRITRNYYASSVLDGILEWSVAAGYQIKIITLTREDPDYAVSQTENGSVDGLALIAPGRMSPLLDVVQNSPLPAVVVGSCQPDLRLPRVDVNDFDAVYQAVAWLVGQGHRQIGHILGPAGQWSSLRREAAYRRALRDAGIPVSESWIRQGDYSGELAAASVESLLRDVADVTALVCGNDQAAILALQVLRRMGVRVPDDVSIIGFDDTDEAAWTHPALTTIHQPMPEIGRRAADILIRQIETGRRDNSITLTPAELVIRESVAPPPVGEHAVCTPQVGAEQA